MSMMVNPYEKWVPFRRAEQAPGFRPPEERQLPPAWWEGPLAGELAGGGGFNGLNVSSMVA
jgi:hypothetical protein